MTPHRYRCANCGNKTRFDVYETVRRRRFEHGSLGGDIAVEEEEVLDRTLERVVCRWCDHDDAIEDLGPARR